MQRNIGKYLSCSHRWNELKSHLINNHKINCIECPLPNSYSLSVFKNINQGRNISQGENETLKLRLGHNLLSNTFNWSTPTTNYNRILTKLNNSTFCTGHIVPAYIVSTGGNTNSKLQRSFYCSQVKRNDIEKDVKDENVLERKLVGDRKHILTVPNILTTGRMIVTPYLGYLVLTESFPLACGVFVLAGISDVVDGWIARHFKNQSTALGSFLDPLADKILISMLYVTLSVVNIIPAALTVLVLSRDVALILAAFYIRYISLPKPVTFKQYFDLTNPSAQLKPLTISKINTAVQFILVAASLSAPVFGLVDHFLLKALWYATATTTAASGICYCIYAKDTFKLSNSPSESGKD